MIFDNSLYDKNKNNFNDNENINNKDYSQINNNKIKYNIIEVDESNLDFEKEEKKDKLKKLEK